MPPTQRSSSVPGPGQASSMVAAIQACAPWPQQPNPAAQQVHGRLSSSKPRHRQRWSCSSSKTAAGIPQLLLLLLFLPALLTRVEARVQRSQASAAAAQPCIECDQCLTASCQRICQPSCRQRAAVSMDACSSKGEDVADEVADAACKAAQAACNAGNKAAPMGLYGAMATNDCSNAAYGACQRAAMSATNTPCGVYLYFGVKACSGRQFSDVYKSRVAVLCKSATNM